MLFFLVFIRMTGFIFLNPVLGRRNIPSLVKTGFVMALSLIVYTAETAKGTVVDIEADMAFSFGLLLIKEFLIGYLLGFVMQLFDLVMTFAGTVIDFQIGISMAQVYDPQNGGQVALSGNILQIFYLLLFFAVDGHLALMKILTESGDVVPYGEVAFAPGAAWMMLDIFAQCIVLAVRMAFPLIAFEFLVEVGVGIVTKITPQVNLFVLSIQLRLATGLIFMIFLVSPFQSFMGDRITQMMNTLSEVLRAAAG